VESDNEDAIDKLMNKQVERTINADLKRVKKGSADYLTRETADMRRIKEQYVGIRKRQKLVLVDKWSTAHS